MKSFLFLVASLSVSISAFAGYQGLPQYIANYSTGETDTGSLEAALAACQKDIAKQKSVVASKGYSIIEESECKIKPSLPGSNYGLAQGSITFIK